VLFVAFTAEEKGLLGSEYFVRQPTVPRSAIVADINIDMPIALTTFADLVAFGADHSTLGHIALAAAQRENLRLAPDPEPDQVRFVRSDQFAFVRNGIPAIQIDTGSHAAQKDINGEEVVEKFRRSRYHMPGDDRDQPIDYAFLATLARVNLHVVYDVANARERQQWNSGDFFAEKAKFAAGD
jgi:Zn-dependent M28 family amino/carboxypeptidase